MTQAEKKPETRYARPAVSDAVSRKLDEFVEQLVSMKVVDAYRIISGLIDRWLEQCSLEEIDSWVKQNLPREKQKAYKRARKRKRRRFFVIWQLDERLMWTHYDPRPERAPFDGWPGTTPRDVALQRIFEIGDWLKTLPFEEAFEAALELTIRWADRYNRDVGLGAARYAWPKEKHNEWTEIQLSGFLRYCAHAGLDTNVGIPKGPWAE